MILERKELKKSTKVAVGAPGRPFKVAKGAFSAPVTLFSSLPQSVHSPFRDGEGRQGENVPLATLNGRPGALTATFVDFFGSIRSRIIQLER